MTGYEYWRGALAGRFEATDGPQPGYYRKFEKDAFIPVAVWITGLEDEYGNPFPVTKLKLGPTMIDHEGEQERIWDRCAKSPVTEDQYWEAMQTGRWFDDLNKPDGTTTRDLTKADPIF